jgi:hypothetical protein
MILGESIATSTVVRLRPCIALRGNLSGRHVKAYLTEVQALRLLCIGGGCNLGPFEELNHWRMP